MCGKASLLKGECDRKESDEGLLGFFADGMLVGKCFRSGRKRASVHTESGVAHFLPECQSPKPQPAWRHGAGEGDVTTYGGG
jgi:hypothetical protein